MSFERDPKGPKSQEDSGVIDLRALVASAATLPQADEGARSGVMEALRPEDMRRDTTPPESATRLIARSEPDTLTPRAVTVTTMGRRSPSTLAAVVVLGAGILSLGGSLALVFARRTPTLPSPPATAPEPRSAEVTLLSFDQVQQRKVAREDTNATPTSTSTSTSTPTSTPTATTTSTALPAPEDPRPAPAAAKAPRALAASPSPAGKPADPAASPAAETALGAAMRASVAEPATEAPTAVKAPPAPAGSLPARPGQGAVTTALASALPKARACLGPDAPILRAMVSFGPSGHVASVTFPVGDARPERPCVERALATAEVPPFAGDVYKAQVTVRPSGG